MDSILVFGMKEYRKRDEQLFLAAYSLWLVSAVLSFTLWQRYDIVDLLCEYLRKTGYLLLVLRFLLKPRYTKQDIAGVFTIIFVCGLTAHAEYNNQLIPVVIFVCNAGNVRMNKILKITLVIQTLLMIATIIGSQTGLIKDQIWYEGDRVRHSLGYDYCGYPAHLLLFMTLMWMCLRKKVRLPDGLVLLVLNYLMYIYTDSRTDFYLSVLGIAGFYVWERIGQFRPLEVFRSIMTRYGFHLACILSIAIHWIYNPENVFMARINVALNNRLQLGLDAIRTYGFSLFGDQIRWFGQGSLKDDPTRIYNYVDCSFLKEGLTFGILFLLLLAVGFYLAGRKIDNRKEYRLGWAVLISLAYSVINAHLCVLTFNVFILVLGTVFSESPCRVKPDEKQEDTAAELCDKVTVNAVPQ